MVAMSVRRKDIKHLQITCRCKNQFIAEVPRQLATAISVHSCDKCHTFYAARFHDEKWQFKRLSETLDTVVAMGPGVFSKIAARAFELEGEEEKKGEETPEGPTFVN